MATRALDHVTIMHAISEIARAVGAEDMYGSSPEALHLLQLVNKYREQLGEITGLNAKASRFWEELNAFLVEHKFDPMIQQFNPADSIGIVAILDKLVYWLHGPGQKVDIEMENGEEKPGFELPETGANVYEVAGYPGNHLIELKTQSHDTLWLFMFDNDQLDGFQLVNLAFDVFLAKRKIVERNGPFGSHALFGPVQIPMLDFDVKPDLNWLMRTNIGSYSITQAVQQFKMRMDDTGARVKVATGIVMTESVSIEPMTYYVDRPFYGWWTQDGIPFPMAVFFADYDSMKIPAGSLEDL